MSDKGIVFNIQKFSIHDGPGIRTTVFLKGCPLRCKWCANPESQLSEVQILYDQKKCLHCQTCVQSCPDQAFSLKKDHIQIDHDRCSGCLSCVRNCPGEALSYEGEEKTADDVTEVCLRMLTFMKSPEAA